VHRPAWLDQQLLGLVTALFVHAEWLHLAGNLAYLWVFGVAVERAIGHWRFLLFFFLLLGSLANLAVAWQMGDAAMPVIGASGGVSAIIGIYLGLFPNRRMGLWIPLGLFPQFVRVPALLVIGSWFILQLLYSAFGPMSGAVAWWSHVAGFIGGLAVALILRLFAGTATSAFYED
jgi:membrane associated rhomboid family serine protease